MSEKSSKATKLVGDQYDPTNNYYQLKSHSARRQVLTSQPGCSKPSIAVLSTGEILVSYIRNYTISNTDRRQPECMELLRSTDGGETWQGPIAITNSSHNDREGYLIRYPDDTLQLCYMRVVPDHPQPWQGPFLVESVDGGKSWGEPWQIDISEFCPNGPFGAGDRGHVVLPDGTLLLFVSTYEEPPRPYEYVLVSRDRGRTFERRHQVADNSGDGSFTLCHDGTIAGLLRINADNWPHRDAHPEMRDQSECVHFMAYTKSADQGRTWSTPQPITGYNEIPGHILQLRDGRLLTSFGVRHYPLGIQAIFTNEAGEWNCDDRMMLCWSGGMYLHHWGYARHTVGHPFTAELPNGQLMTAYYRFSDPFDPWSCQVEAIFWEPPK